MNQTSFRMKCWTTVLVMVLVATAILSACSNRAAEPPPSAAAENGGRTETPAQQEPPQIHIVTSHQNTAYIKAVTNWDDDPYVRKMEEMSGYDIKFEFLEAPPDYGSQLTVRFASGDLPDLIWTTGIEDPAHAGAVDQGAFLELGDLIDQYGPNIKKNISDDIWSNSRVSKDGNIYAIPLLTPFRSYAIAFYREDWLEKAGMTELNTLDDYLQFYEYIKTHDMNGNGEHDEYGFYARENMASSEMFFGAFGVLPYRWSLRDGQLIPDMITPEMKQAVGFWRDLYAKGYVNPNMFTNKGLDWDAGIRNGKGATWMHYVNNYYSWTVDYIEEDARIGMLPSPTGLDGKQGFSMKSSGIWNVWVIPAKTAHPEKVIQFIDWAWSDPEAEEFFAFGIEGRNFTRENGKIVWDETNPRNQENDEKAAYQYVMNPTGLAAGNAKTLDALPDELKNRLLQGYEDADRSTMNNDAEGMPTLEAFRTNPELGTGFGAGTLFLDMFAKVVTGKEELDPAFDNFVAEWRRRGGDAGIREATDWYNSK